MKNRDSMVPKGKYPVGSQKKLRTDPDVVRRREQRVRRQQSALQLRMSGASFADIVRADIGYKSITHVSYDMKKMLVDFQQAYEAPADLIALDLARLDDIQRRLYMAFHTGDLAQASMILRVMQFRREILGITPEVAASARENSNALVNNGIMVVQGSAEDYLKTMMQAAGASPEQQRAELDRIAASNRTAPTEPIVDAEVVEDGSETAQEDSESTSGARPRKKLRKPKRRLETTSELDDPLDSTELEKSLLELEELESGTEKLPTLQLSDPILSIDIPEESQPQKKRLRVRVKPDDTNRNPVSGVPYRSAPRKPSPELSQKRLKAKGAQPISSGPNRGDVFPGNGVSSQMYDEIETETLSQRID